MQESIAVAVSDFDQSYYRSDKDIKRRKTRERKALVDKGYIDSPKSSPKMMAGKKLSAGEVLTNGTINSDSITTNSVMFNSSIGTGIQYADDYSANFVAGSAGSTGQIGEAGPSGGAQAMVGNATLSNSNIGYFGDGFNTQPLFIDNWRDNTWWEPYQPIRPYNPIIPYDNIRPGGGYVVTDDLLQWKNTLVEQTEIEFMENVVQFFSLPGYAKTDLKVQVVKDQVQISAERDEIEGFDQDDRNCTFKNAVKFDEETHDAKKVKVSFLNGLVRVEVPLREDIVEDITVE